MIDLKAESLRDLAYSSGRAKHWIKVKNPKAPAALRLDDGTF